MTLNLLQPSVGIRGAANAVEEVFKADWLGAGFWSALTGLSVASASTLSALRPRYSPSPAAVRAYSKRWMLLE